MQLTPHSLLWDKVNFSEDGCWLWTGAVSGGGGYGNIRFEGKQTTPHRVSWILSFGEIPDGLMVCHSCDVRICINPNHLFLGTGSDNKQDEITKGRISSLRKEFL